MLSLNFRAPIAKFLVRPVAWLARTSLTPDVVTVVGGVGSVTCALVFLPRGTFVAGTLAVTVFVLLDLLDGQLARARGSSTVWGAFLDSTLDRVADGAIFAAIALWYAGGGHSVTLCGVALYCLVSGSVTSYIKARAESLQLTCNVGIAERAERLIVILVATFVSGLGVPVVLPAALWVLAALTTVTVYQRLAEVHRQAGGIAKIPLPSKEH